MKTFPGRDLAFACFAMALAVPAWSQSTPAKKELVQKILTIQQAEIENVARGIVERPAQQMMQEAALAIQRQVPRTGAMRSLARSRPRSRNTSTSRYPLVRERALRIAPSTIGATLEDKMSEDDLRQLLAWLDSPANRKYQQLGADMRNAFIQKLLLDARPVVDPKVTALDGRIRVILGLPAAPAGTSGPGPTPARRRPREPRGRRRLRAAPPATAGWHDLLRLGARHRAREPAVADRRARPRAARPSSTGAPASPCRSAR